MEKTHKRDTGGAKCRMKNSTKQHITNAVEITEDVLSIACPIAGTLLSIGEKVVDEIEEKIEERREHEYET